MASPPDFQRVSPAPAINKVITLHGRYFVDLWAQAELYITDDYGNDITEILRAYTRRARYQHSSNRCYVVIEADRFHVSFNLDFVNAVPLMFTRSGNHENKELRVLDWFVDANPESMSTASDPYGMDFLYSSASDNDPAFMLPTTVRA